MIDKFEKDRYYDTKKIEEQFKDLNLLFKIGTEPWALSLYYIPSKQIYLEKSPIDRLNDSMYFLCSVNDGISPQDWKVNSIKKWNRMFPNKKIIEE